MTFNDYLATHQPGHPTNCQPYLLAEAGVNHDCKMDLAKRLVDEAAEGGADGIKFQTYKAETLACRRSPSYWDRGSEPEGSQFQLFKKYDRFWKKEYEALKGYCDQVGIEFSSTPFDFESAAFLNDMMSFFKISSSDLTNKPFIEYMCGFGKPIVLSTGASTVAEIREAVAWIEVFDLPVTLLHCVLSYPTAPENANLGMIADLVRLFPDKRIGYSDHVAPDADALVLTAARLLGATFIEKHFTYDKSLPGNDHYHAMDMRDLHVIREKLAAALCLVGGCAKEPVAAELAARENARRSIVAIRDLQPGEVVGRDDLTFKRPGTGISPRELATVLGRRLSRKVEADTPLVEDDLEPGDASV